MSCCAKYSLNDRCCLHITGISFLIFIAFHCMTVSPGPIPRPEKSYQLCVCVCVCHSVWSTPTVSTQEVVWVRKILDIWKPIGCPETSVKCFQFSLCNSPEERSSQVRFSVKARVRLINEANEETYPVLADQNYLTTCSPVRFNCLREFPFFKLLRSANLPPWNLQYLCHSFRP